MTSMGMDKSGNFDLGVANTWVKVAGFVVRAGYPGTNLVNDALVMNEGATGTIRAQGRFSLTSGTQQFRVVRNGVDVVAGPANTQVLMTQPGVAVSTGDTLELQAFASSTTFDTVSGGSTNTFLEFNQTTTNYNIDAAPATTTWNRTATVAVGAAAAAAPVEVGWNRTASMSRGGDIGATRDIGWDIDADLYQGEHYTAESEATIGWTVEAGLTLTPKVSTPPSVFSFADVAVSVHTWDGRAVGDFPCQSISAFNWGREDTEVSGCELTIQTAAEPILLEELRQWYHWITVWHDQEPVWRGPIQRIRLGRTASTITARDPSTLMWRTRVPITRTFVDTSPSRIADVLWRAMYDHHGISGTPVMLPDVSDDTFTIAAAADSKMLYQLMDELVQVGLHWTVVAGRPVLGTFPRVPVVALQECDFLVELERVRDGTQLFNDIRVQGQNWAQNAIVDVGGLRLQNIVSLDDLRGAANVERAAEQRAREDAQLRDELVVPAQASLHPQAPVSLDDLVPGKVFAVHTETVVQLMRLDQVHVSGTAEAFDVQVSLVALNEPEDGSAVLTGGGV